MSLVIKCVWGRGSGSMRWELHLGGGCRQTTSSHGEPTKKAQLYSMLLK